MPDVDRIFQKNENFVFRQIDDETILVPIKDNLGDMGSIYNLNEVGAFVWKHLDGKASLADIKNMILETFEVYEREADADLSDFVNQLKEIDAILPIEQENN
jgi:methyltransferase-like protein